MTNEEKKVILTAMRRQLRNVALLSTALCKKDCNDCVFDMSHEFDPKCGFGLIDACIEDIDECFRRIKEAED